ncbi:hypothetical protein ABR850_04005 [Aeromonas veronii]|uniref:hypothetical protein n=1 Tax=Aeromonas veronii TaxID=654 RepID=UPI003305802A
MEHLITTVITSALVATVVGALINAWLDSLKSKHATRFDALSTAVALEGYALTCAERIADHDLAISSNGHAGTFLSGIPELPELSVVAGFLHPKKASVANRLMIFHQEIRQSDQYISFMWDVSADVEVARSIAVSEVAHIGLKALVLATEIRSVFRLPIRELVFGEFNVRQTLESSSKEQVNG